MNGNEQKRAHMSIHTETDLLVAVRNSECFFKVLIWQNRSFRTYIPKYNKTRLHFHENEKVVDIVAIITGIE